MEFFFGFSTWHVNDIMVGLEILSHPVLHNIPFHDKVEGA